MPIAFAQRLAFVHIQKVAGMSIVDGLRRAGLQFEYAGHGLAGLWPEGTRGERIRERFERRVSTANTAHFPHQHLPAAVLRDLVGERTWNECFTFAFVRNPWDRFVSFYHYMLALRDGPDLRERQPGWAKLLEEAPDFDAFVRGYPRDGRDMTSMVTDYDGSLMVDFVGRYEDLEADLARVVQRTGIPFHIPHINATEHGPYRDYYTRETRAIVHDLYAEDIERFAYRF
jgi:hypothetical protein